MGKIPIKIYGDRGKKNILFVYKSLLFFQSKEMVVKVNWLKKWKEQSFLSLKGKIRKYVYFQSSFSKLSYYFVGKMLKVLFWQPNKRLKSAFKRTK